MKDRNGNEVTIGARAFVLPSERDGRDGGPGWVHDIKPCSWAKGNPPMARVSDRQDDDLEKMIWGAWCREKELEIIP